MATVHLHNPNTARFDEFVDDSEWAGEPFWMLNTFAYHPGAAAAEANRAYGNSMQGILSDVGARIVMQARVARTVIGERSWEAAAVVEYPSPQAFYEMATSAALEAASGQRQTAFRDQFLIPISAGWMPGFDPDKPVNARGDIRTWSSSDLADTDNAFVGDHPTQASSEQAADLVSDERFRDTPVWMLNLLKYAPDGGKQKHDAYAAGGGNDFPGGSLGRQFGLRVVYSARRTFASLIGSTDWDSVAMVGYPSRDHFLSMGANPNYIALHEGRKAGLSETYIVAMQSRLF
ncbi:MAG: hypothetical protein O7H39_06875 [Gammaproteobacteria bacterium]|nr:hypothetical protein [Gammaproteobacteria bacterium]